METSGTIIPGVHKIAVLRANAIGDLVFSMPAFEALRAAYPQAEIVLLGQRWHHDFLTGRPGPIDRVVMVPPAVGVTLPDDAANGDMDLEPFLARMRAERFDLALQMHGGGRHSNPFVLRLGARVTAGLRAADAPAPDRWLRYVYFQPEVLRYLEVVSLVGARPVGIEPRIAVTDRDRAESRQMVLETSRPLAVLHPGVGDGRRCWPPEKFAAVGRELAGAGCRVAVTGHRDEHARAASIARAIGERAIDLCGRLSLGGLGGLLSRAVVVVANDTGPLHLAGAVGAATVGIFWCGNLVTAGPPFRARHRPLIAWRLDCPRCGRDCIYDNCGHHDSFVADVPVEEVLAAAMELLDGRSAQSAPEEATAAIPS